MVRETEDSMNIRSSYTAGFTLGQILDNVFNGAYETVKEGVGAVMYVVGYGAGLVSAGALTFNAYSHFFEDSPSGKNMALSGAALAGSLVVSRIGKRLAGGSFNSDDEGTITSMQDDEKGLESEVSE